MTDMTDTGRGNAGRDLLRTCDGPEEELPPRTRPSEGYPLGRLVPRTPYGRPALLNPPRGHRSGRRGRDLRRHKDPELTVIHDTDHDELLAMRLLHRKARDYAPQDDSCAAMRQASEAASLRESPVKLLWPEVPCQRVACPPLGLGELLERSQCPASLAALLARVVGRTSRVSSASNCSTSACVPATKVHSRSTSVATNQA